MNSLAANWSSKILLILEISCCCCCGDNEWNVSLTASPFMSTFEEEVVTRRQKDFFLFFHSMSYQWESELNSSDEMFNLLLLLLSTSYNNCKRCLRAIVDPSSLRILSNDNYVNKCGHYSNSNNNHHHYNNHLIIFQQCARVLPYEKSSSHSMEGREGDFKLNNNNSSTRRKNDPNKSTNRTNHNSISSSFSPSTTTTTETLIPVKQSPQTSDRSIVSNVLPKSAAQFGVSNICLLLLFLVNPIHCGHSVHCGHLLIGQYRCPQPEIDVLTQQVPSSWSLWGDILIIIIKTCLMKSQSID